MKFHSATISSAIVLLLTSCSDSPRITKDMLAPEPNYPKELEYDENQKRYLGAPGNELMDSHLRHTEKESFGRPISTFGQAFEAAYELLTEEYKKELIDEQLPLLIDHRDGVWIVNGAFPRSSDPNVSVLGGTAHLAFEAESGRIIYLWHSL